MSRPASVKAAPFSAPDDIGLIPTRFLQLGDHMDWPRKNETLFQVDKDWHNNACLNPYWTSLARYGENYKDAADTLIDAAVSGHAYIDVVVYPVVFMYRQYLELTLKDIILRTRQLENDGSGFPKTHKLDVLWPEAKKLLNAHYGDDTPQELDYLDSCFTEFTEHDPNSIAFRYPFDKNGNKHLMNLSHINLRHLRETMERVANFLSCIAGHIEERLQWQSEMEAELRAEMAYYGEP